MKSWVLVSLILLVMPTTSNAYFTTDQQAVRLNDHQLLFTITYQFGFAKRELFIPILTERGLKDFSTHDRIAFELELDGKPTSIGDVTAIALTKDEDALVKKDLYHLDSYRSAPFVLMAIVTLPADHTTELTDGELSLHVTHLPFKMIHEDGTVVLAHLNPLELEKYRTPSISAYANLTTALQEPISLPSGLPLK